MAAAPARISGNARKPRGQGHERVEEILAIAKAMFLAEGFDAVTTRRLAERVGLSQAGLYVYFKSKEEILDALCQRAYETTLSAFRRIEEEVSDDLERFRRTLRVFVEIGLDHPEEYQIIYMRPRALLYGLGEGPGRGARESRGVQVVRWQHDLVRRLIRTGVFRTMNAKVACQVALFAPHGLIAKLIAWPDFPWAQRDALIDATIECLVAGFLAPGCVSSSRKPLKDGHE
ncbi:MAG: TetR/AcrR family transcriptional regulator [Hyphomonadaceae bacterium]|nr:TetR/AcrR family transcriptional regulator [Hyphomonadaceae bacterium]